VKKSTFFHAGITFFSLFFTLASKKKSTYPTVQCPAVTMWLPLMSDPPQNGSLLPLLPMMAAIHGYSFTSVVEPPMILARRLIRPQAATVHPNHNSYSLPQHAVLSDGSLCPFCLFNLSCTALHCVAPSTSTKQDAEPPTKSTSFSP
jgi:hypothetical protein